MGSLSQVAAILLTNLRLLDPRDMNVTSGLKVLVRGDRIQDVAKAPTLPRDAEVIDLGGRILMPGLIDCHVHIISTHVRMGLNPQRYLPSSLVTSLALKNLEAMAMRGFTSVRDAGGADLGHKLAMERGLFPGPRLLISGRAISQTGGHGDARERVDSCEPAECGCAHLFGGMARIADGESEVRRAARDEIRLGADQIKVMASGGVASPTDPIQSLQYSMQELFALVDEAQRAGTYVLAHAYTADAIRRVVEAGVRTIEHGNLIDRETAEFMAQRGAYLVPTLVTYDALATNGKALGFPEESLAKLARVVEVGADSLKIAQAAGVKMAFGTDLLGELQVNQSEEFRIRSEVLGSDEVLRSATLIGAEVLRMEGLLGVVAPGAFADLIALEADPLEDISVLLGQGEQIPLVMREGRLLKNRLS